MRNFLLVLGIVILVPVIYFMGIQGLSFHEMLTRLGLSKELFVQQEGE